MGSIYLLLQSEFDSANEGHLSPGNVTYGSKQGHFEVILGHFPNLNLVSGEITRSSSNG